jgi:hypothetical protein
VADQFPHDIDSYIEGKKDFILEILEKSGFSPGELAWVANPT